MTVQVYLRSSFGFSYLRPKSVFLAFSWAFTLYAIYAWIDGTAWHQHRAALFFGGGAIILYGIHLASAVLREWNRTGEHDNYSGASHIFWLMNRANVQLPFDSESQFHLWVEPGAVLLASAILRLILGERGLSAWLLLATICFWSKEAFNRWFHLRQQKRRQDSFDDTEETMEPPKTTSLASEPPRATRKSRVKRGRSSDGQLIEATEK